MQALLIEWGFRRWRAIVLTEQIFSNEFLALTEGWSWEIEGFVDKQGYVHPIDSDTKVISTVFERLCSPVLRSIGKKYGYIVETANQTTYPDFTLSKYEGFQLIHRIAVDIKTTYRSSSMLFTLGGYNSFLRNGTKNILYPYSTYSEHWVVGFVYSQNPAFPIYDLDNMPRNGDISCPYRDVYVFVRSKHLISGLRAGSGNTKNIGSVKVRSATDFSTLAGPFSRFAQAREACDHYWKNYELYSNTIQTELDLINHPDFSQYR